MSKVEIQIPIKSVQLCASVLVYIMACLIRWRSPSTVFGLSIRLMSSSPSPTISIISYRKLVSSCLLERRKLFESLSDIGFFYIGDYEEAVPAVLVRQMKAHTDKLFGATEQEKRSVHLSKSPHFRGWSGLNEEVTLGVPDYKETFDFGIDESPLAVAPVNPDQGWRNMRGPNQYPSNMRGTSFEVDMQRYMSGVSRIGRVVMDSAALCLGRETESLDRFFSNPFCILRMCKYPPSLDGLANEMVIEAEGGVSSEPKIGIGTHSDYGFLTLIQQDNHVNGLQALSRTGRWVDVDPIPDTFAVNIGDMCEAWSNGVYRSTPHRVINHSRMRQCSSGVSVTDVVESTACTSQHCKQTVVGVDSMQERVEGEAGTGTGTQLQTQTCGRAARVSMAFFYEPALESVVDANMLALSHEGADPLQVYGQHLHRAYLRSYPAIAATDINRNSEE